MRILQIQIALVSVLALGACNKRNNSDLQHRDDPLTRGAEEEAPWHFHTGTGSIVDEITDSTSGKSIVVRASCELLTEAADPRCKEKVYFFTRSEINSFIGVARDVHKANLKGHLATVAGASTIAVVSGKAAAASAVSPGGQWITVGAGIVSGIAAVVVTWESYEAGKVLLQMKRIDQLMAEEAAFVNRCNHIRKDFLERAQALGVSIIFAKNGGDYIDGNEYRNSIKIEDDLYTRTLEYARKKSITSRQAYKEYFSAQCGQLPTTTLTKSERLFAADWAVVPEDVKQETILASNKVALQSRELIQLARFDSNDITSAPEKKSMETFMRQVSSDIQTIETKGNAKEKAALESFRKKYNRIIVQPRWGAWDIFSSEYYTYETATDQSKTNLHVYAIWSASAGAYQITMRPFFTEQLGIRESLFR